MTFSQSAQVIAPPTTDRRLVSDGIESLTANGGTAMGDALDLSLRGAPGARGAGNDGHGKPSQAGSWAATGPRRSSCCPTARTPRHAQPD